MLKLKGKLNVVSHVNGEFTYTAKFVGVSSHEQTKLSVDAEAQGQKFADVEINFRNEQTKKLVVEAHIPQVVQGSANMVYSPEQRLEAKMVATVRPATSAERKVEGNVAMDFQGRHITAEAAWDVGRSPDKKVSVDLTYNIDSSSMHYEVQ